jgi:hypothetical protein
MPILGIVASARAKEVPGIYYLFTSTVSGSSTSSVSLSSFSGYDDLMILSSAKTSNNANADNQMTFNNDTTANAYRAKLLFASSGTNGESMAGPNIYRAGYQTYSDMTANYYGNSMFYIHDYASTSTYKTMRWQGISPINTSAGYMIMAEAVCYWTNTNAITSVQMTCAGFGSTYADGTQFFVYGIKR